MIIDVHAHYLPTLLIEGFDAAHAAFSGVQLLRDAMLGGNARRVFRLRPDCAC
jgi:hypothetical protein